jgi:hypothetical protein
MGPARARLSAWLVALAATACSRSRVTAATTDDGHVAAVPDAAPAPPPASSSDPPLPEAGTNVEAVMLRPDAPTIRYARLNRRACEAELRRRKIRFEPAVATPGVVAPVWLRGPLHGVAIHSGLPPKKRLRSRWEIFDCRLVLALDDFTSLVAAHDVVEIVHLSAFRSRADRGCLPKHDGKQHCGALAVDVGTFRKKDGSVLQVEQDFHGRIGLASCAPNVSPAPSSPAADELWSYVCESARRATFNVILTPNYNEEHRNHFHLEVTPNARWMLIH